MAKSTTSLTSESTKVVERKTRRKPGPGSGEPQDQPASTPSVPAKPDEVDLFTFHPVKWHDGENAEMRIEPRNADSVRQTFGSESPAINTALLKQIMFFQSIEEATSHMDKRAFAAAIVREIEPRDAFERMLAAEMVFVIFTTRPFRSTPMRLAGQSPRA